MSIQQFLKILIFRNFIKKNDKIKLLPTVFLLEKVRILIIDQKNLMPGTISPKCPLGGDLIEISLFVEVKPSNFFLPFLARATEGTLLYGLCLSVCVHIYFSLTSLCLNDQAYNCLIHFYKRDC